jgi:DNA (cytosine-5)-methyltransferase 1
LGRWPRSGMMRNGIAYRLRPLVPRISGTGFSFWVTPTATDGMRGNKAARPHDTGVPLSQQVVMPHRWPTPRSADANRGPDYGATANHQGGGNLLGAVKTCDEVSGQLNPTWVEWLMGFPLGWTDLEDSEMQ